MFFIQQTIIHLEPTHYFFQYDTSMITILQHLNLHHQTAHW